MVSFPPLPTFGATSPPLKILSTGSLFSFASRNRKINMANRALEVAVWVAEQSLQCPSKFIGLNIIFPEDLGGHCVHGPSSIWVLREFRFLEGVRDARRAAAYMCQFTRSEYKRPTGILSNCTSIRPLLFLGWPNLLGVQDSLKYKGPLPLSCSCGREHPPLLVWLTILPSSPPLQLVSVPVSGLPVSTTIC